MVVKVGAPAQVMLAGPYRLYVIVPVGPLGPPPLVRAPVAVVEGATHERETVSTGVFLLTVTCAEAALHGVGADGLLAALPP